MHRRGATSRGPHLRGPDCRRHRSRQVLQVHLQLKPHGILLRPRLSGMRQQSLPVSVFCKDSCSRATIRGEGEKKRTFAFMLRVYCFSWLLWVVWVQLSLALCASWFVAHTCCSFFFLIFFFLVCVCVVVIPRTRFASLTMRLEGGVSLGSTTIRRLPVSSMLLNAQIHKSQICLKCTNAKVPTIDFHSSLAGLISTATCTSAQNTQKSNPKG